MKSNKIETKEREQKQRERDIPLNFVAGATYLHHTTHASTREKNPEEKEI